MLMACGMLLSRTSGVDHCFFHKSELSGVIFDVTRKICTMISTLDRRRFFGVFTNEEVRNPGSHGKAVRDPNSDRTGRWRRCSADERRWANDLVDVVFRFVERARDGVMQRLVWGCLLCSLVGWGLMQLPFMMPLAAQTTSSVAEPTPADAEVDENSATILPAEANRETTHEFAKLTEITARIIVDDQENVKKFLELVKTPAGQVIMADRAAMQAQEEEVQKQMLADARSAQSSEVGSGEFSEYDVVLQSQERTIDPETMPHLSADYGGYRDFGTFAPPSGHGYGSGQGQGQGYGSGQGQGQGQGSGPFNGGRCSWR